jgi:uncharacterized protein YgiM (DUF1202 family)
MAPLLVLILSISMLASARLMTRSAVVLAGSARPRTGTRATLMRVASLAIALGALTACGDASEPASTALSTVLEFPVPAAHAATRSSFLPVTESPSLTTLYAHSTINIRSRPSRTASIVRTVRAGDSVTVADAEDGWSAVMEGGETTGYVSRTTSSLRSSRPAAIQQLLPSGRFRSSGGGSAGSRRYHLGPRGGCYYYTGSGNKQYVPRSNCH